MFYVFERDLRAALETEFRASAPAPKFARSDAFGRFQKELVGRMRQPARLAPALPFNKEADGADAADGAVALPPALAGKSPGNARLSFAVAVTPPVPGVAAPEPDDDEPPESRPLALAASCTSCC